MTNAGKPCGCGCSDALQSLITLLDGDCTPERQEQLRRHIESCPACFERLGIEEEVRELVRKCCCTPAPRTLRERITYSIRIERRVL